MLQKVTMYATLPYWKLDLKRRREQSVGAFYNVVEVCAAERCVDIIGRLFLVTSMSLSVVAVADLEVVVDPCSTATTTSSMLRVAGFCFRCY